MREHLEPLLSVCTHGVYTLCVHTVCTQTGVYTHTLVWYRTGTCDTCDTCRWYRNRASAWSRCFEAALPYLGYMYVYPIPVCVLCSSTVIPCSIALVLNLVPRCIVHESLYTKLPWASDRAWSEPILLNHVESCRSDIYFVEFCW